MNKSQKNNSRKKSNKREFLKTKSSEIVDYFPRDNNDDDFGFNFANMDTKNLLFSSNNQLLKKKRKQGSLKNNIKKEIDLKDNMDDLDFNIDENEKKISSRAYMPNFKVGDLVLLNICEIRQTYMIANFTRNRKAMIHVNYSGFDVNEENFSFKNYFKISQFVCGAVISPGNDIQLPQGYMNKKISVSIDPKIVNTGLKIETLVEGMDLWGKFIFDSNKKSYSAEFSFTNSEDELLNFNEKFIDENENEQSDDFSDNPNEDSIKENINLNEESISNEEFDSDENSNQNEENLNFEDNILNNSKIKKNYKINKSQKISVKIIDLDKESKYFDPEVIKNKILNSYYFFKLVKIQKEENLINLEVSLNINKLKFGIKKLDFSQIRPGFLFKANLTRELLNGIEVAFAGNIGTIFSDHLKIMNKKTNNFYVRVIHISVTKKNISLSSLTHITNLYNEKIEEKFNLIGNVYKNSILDKELYGGSFLIKFSEEQIGFIHKNNISDLDIDILAHDKEKYVENNASENKKKNKKTIIKNLNENKEEKDILPIIGAKIPLVIAKEYNFFDDRAILKTIDFNESEELKGKSKNKKNIRNNKDSINTVLNNKLITWKNLKIGTMLDVVIKEIHSDYLVVSINEFISGKITKELLSDYNFQKIPKKFQVGNKIRCRIFKCDFETKNLQFIAKESLMDESIILFDSLESLKEGEEIPVIYIGNGLFQHSGDIVGKLQNFNLYNNKENFRIAKAYNLHVFKININTRRLILSKEKNVFLPSFGDFEIYLRRHPLLLTVLNELNKEYEDEKQIENFKSQNKKKYQKNKKYLNIDEIQEGNIYDFEIVPVKKILRLLEKKGIDLNLINEDLELLTKKILFVKFPEIDFYGFLQVELLADFFVDQQFQIYYELGNKVSEILKEIDYDKNLSNPLSGFEISENKNIMKKLLIVFFDKEKKILFTSGKNSLIRYSKINLIPKSKEEIFIPQKDSLYCGYVNKINEKGVIVQFLGKYKFLIRNKTNFMEKERKYSEENINSKNIFVEKINNFNDYYLSKLQPGQTILVSSIYDKEKKKLRFSTGIDIYKSKQGTNINYNEDKIIDESQYILENYINDLNFCCLHNRIFMELNDLYRESNISINNQEELKPLEGTIGKLNLEDEEINVQLKNHSNFKACLKICNSQFFNKDTYSDPQEIYEKYNKNFNFNKFLIYDVNYDNEIIYLTDNYTIDKNINLIKKGEKSKNLETTYKEFIVDGIFENYISCHLESQPSTQAILPCDLYNFKYSKLFNEFQTKNNQKYSEKIRLSNSEMNTIDFAIIPGDKIKCFIKSFDDNLKKYILNSPKNEILQTIKTFIKLSNSYRANSNSSSRKNSDFEKITYIAPGITFIRQINGIKNKYLYIFINKKTIGRINIKDFNGDYDEIKKILKETNYSRKNFDKQYKQNETEVDQVESLEDNKLNLNLNLLKSKFKILHIEQTDNMEIIDLINIDKDNTSELENELSIIDETTKMDGETPYKGIISKIDFSNKYPIRIDYRNSIEKKLKSSKQSQDSSFQILYENIYNFNLPEINKSSFDEKSNFKINEMFSLGQNVNFYVKKEKDGTVIASLVPFSKLIKNIQIDHKYLVRILKSIPGRGLVISIFDTNEKSSGKKSHYNQDSIKTEAFVDISEISDDLYANPLNFFIKGQVVIGRVLNFDLENSKKFFVSLRQSITNDSLYDILKNGSTIKFTKYFDQYEKNGDFRNKIYKFGANQVLESNQIIMGYITSSSEKGVFIKVGAETIVRAALNELTDEKVTNPYLLFKQNQLIISRIIFIDKKEIDKKTQLKVSVSLRESVIKYNLTLKKRDLKKNNFYECQILNENSEKYLISVIGSTFTGVLEKKAEFIKKDAKILKELKEFMENKNSLILEIVELDTSVFPNIIKFSNLNIDNQNNFDKNLVINLLSEQDKINYENNSELFNNVKTIIEREQENELTDEMKELEKEAEEVDFEALIEKKGNEEEIYEEEQAENEQEENEILNIESEEEEDRSDLIVKFHFLFFWKFVKNN